MSIFKAFFGLGKIPQVVKFFEFKSFDDVNKMGGAIAQIKQQVREGGLQLTKSQQKFLDDQMKQVEMVFEQLQQPTKETGIKSTQSAKIFDLQGQEIPQGSKIMGGKAVDDTKMIDDAIENASPGFVKGDTKYNAELVAEDLAERMGVVYDDLDTRQRADIYGKAYDRLSKRNFQLRQTEKQIAERLGRENKKAVGNIRKKKLRDEISKLDDKIEARKLQLEQRGVEDFETDSLFNKLDEQRNDLELKLDFEDMVDPEDMAQGGRAGYFLGGLGRIIKAASETSPLQAYKRYLQSVKNRAQKGDMKSLAPELGVVTAGGIFINRRVQDVLKNMKEKDMENNLENFKKELNADPFYKKYPELKDKTIEAYTERLFGEKKADGGRAGFKEGNKKITIDAAGSKSGKQQIMGAPKGITADRESIDAIIKADIPISEKIDLLAKYQYGKGRTRIEKDGQEIFLDEGGFKSRDIGLGFNKEGEGIGGTLTYNLESGEPEFNIGFRKRFNEGGRIGFKDGMTRRTFMKILGGAMAIPIVGKFLKLAKVGQAVKKVPIIKTADVPGKPEWFDQLVNKVITEGDDMTRQFATKEREIVHATKIDEDNFVIVTQDLDEGAVRVEYQSDANVFGETVQLQYKKPLPDESVPNPKAEFTTAESGPVGRQVGPDDYDIEVDEVGGTSIRDLDSDVSKLKEYATGQKPTMKELVQNIERRKKAQRITDDPEAQSDALIRRQGEAFPDTPGEDFASGGIARMLGE